MDRPGSVQQRLYDSPGSLYPSEYAEDHLPGAINLPLRRLEQQTTESQQPKPIEGTLNCQLQPSRELQQAKGGTSGSWEDEPSAV